MHENTEQKTDAMTLEDLVKLANKVGMELVEAKKTSDRYELLKASVRSKVMQRLDDGKLSESKLRRLMEMDEEYTSYLQKLLDARSYTDRIRIRYESYKNLFEARRSMLSYRKAEMHLL